MVITGLLFYFKTNLRPWFLPCCIWGLVFFEQKCKNVLSPLKQVRFGEFFGGVHSSQYLLARYLRSSVDVIPGQEDSQQWVSLFLDS